MIKQLAVISVVASLASTAWAANFTPSQIASKFHANGYKSVLLKKAASGETTIKGRLNNRAHVIVLSANGSVIENTVDGQDTAAIAGAAVADAQEGIYEETQADRDELNALPDDTNVDHSAYARPIAADEGTDPLAVASDENDDSSEGIYEETQADMDELNALPDDTDVDHSAYARPIAADEGIDPLAVAYDEGDAVTSGAEGDDQEGIYEETQADMDELNALPDDTDVVHSHWAR